MKKIIAILAAACIFFSFSACGSSSSESNGMYDKAAVAEQEVLDKESSQDGGLGDNSQINLSDGEDTQSNIERKIIWTVDMHLETKDMDTLLASFNTQIEKVNGYIENSSISGKRADDYYGQRYASITARIPSDKLDGFLQEVGNIATVINTDKQREDITFQYTDTENRLKSLKMEQDKLYELLDKATDLESIIRLEERLTEVRHQIENYNSALKLYDNQVYYSTVNFSIYEVDRVTEQVDKSLSSRISTGFSNTLYNIKNSSEDILVFVVVNSPIFVILALVMVAVVLIIKKIEAASRKRREAFYKANNIPQKPIVNPTKEDDNKDFPEQS